MKAPILKKDMKQNGFTIVELLVTIFVFSVMALTTTAIFIRAMDIERRSFNTQAIQENAIAVLELMAKEIRVSTISSGDSNCSAGSLDMTVYDSGGNPRAVTYQLDGASGTIRRIYGGVTYQVSSTDVIFDRLLFCIANTGIDHMPTRITILTAIRNRKGTPMTVNLQTTVTSRDVAVEFQN